MKLFILKKVYANNCSDYNINELELSQDIFVYKSEEEREQNLKELFKDDVENELHLYLNVDDGKVYEEEEYENEVEDGGYFEVDLYDSISWWDVDGCGATIKYEKEEIEID